jgi:membrane-bound lytic murein transglycosylase B
VSINIYEIREKEIMFFIKGKYGIVIIFLAVLILSSARISFSTNCSNETQNKINFFAPVINMLLEKGADTAFVYRIIKNPKVQFDDKYVRINVSNFLNKPNYTFIYNETSVKKTKDFINRNYDILNLAETEYNVPKEVISSILWIETKHGTFLGNNPIVSVYLSTALCNQSDFLNNNLNILRKNFEGSDSELCSLEDKMRERSLKKEQWAIQELLALQILEKISPTPILDIKGSWAGAFGMSQFLPSSYICWAVDGNKDGIIDLFDKTDAIFSVANYLKKNGWNDSPQGKFAAVYHYNNSSDYVDAVLKLSDLACESKINENDTILPPLIQH